MSKSLFKDLDTTQARQLVMTTLSRCKDIQSLSVVYLSKYFNVSQRTLLRSFKKLELPSPATLIVEYKVSLAMHYLQEHTTITDVATKSGFKTIEGFTKAFRRVTGLSVRQYIDNHTDRARNLSEKIAKSIIKTAIKIYRKKELDIDMFANELGISQRELNRRSKKHLGLSPIKVIHYFRIKRAKRLLKLNYPTKLIVEMTGFGGVSGFRHGFIREVGMTPDSFRYINNQGKTVELEKRIRDYLGSDCNLDSNANIKIALREELNVLLPQRPSLIASLQNSVSTHEIIGLLIDYLTDNR